MRGGSPIFVDVFKLCCLISPYLRSAQEVIQKLIFFFIIVSLYKINIPVKYLTYFIYSWLNKQRPKLVWIIDISMKMCLMRFNYSDVTSISHWKDSNNLNVYTFNCSSLTDLLSLINSIVYLTNKTEMLNSFSLKTSVCLFPVPRQKKQKKPFLQEISKR